MRPIRPFAMLVPAIAIAACAPSQETTSTPAPPVAQETSTCGADALQAYIGRKATDEVVAEIKAARGDKPVRVLRPGSVITMDYREDRLNLELDENDVIKAMRCV